MTGLYDLSNHLHLFIACLLVLYIIMNYIPLYFENGEICVNISSSSGVPQCLSSLCSYGEGERSNSHEENTPCYSRMHESAGAVGDVAFAGYKGYRL